MVILLRHTNLDDYTHAANNLKQVLETVDRGLLLGNSFRKELCHIATAICTILRHFGIITLIDFS